MPDLRVVRGGGARGGADWPAAGAAGGQAGHSLQTAETHGHLLAAGTQHYRGGHQQEVASTKVPAGQALTAHTLSVVDHLELCGQITEERESSTIVTCIANILCCKF